MNKYNILAYATIMVLSVFIFSACEEETIILPGEQQNQLRVVGTAKATETPDIATTQIGVQTFNREVEPAVAENNRIAEAIIGAMRQQGIDEKDIKTTNFSIYPQRNWQNGGQGEITGFQVDNMISVTIRNLNIVGKALQAAINAGANNVYGLNFGIDDTETLKRELRLKAIEDARKQAEDIASAAGVELGKIITINDVSYSIPSARVDYDKAAAESAVPIQAGDLDITVQVEIVFSIL